MKNLILIIIALAFTECEKQENVQKDSIPFQKHQLKSPSMAEKHPLYLYKVSSVNNWTKSHNNLHLSEMDSEFIHFSTEEQLDKIIEKFWANDPEYIILKVEVAKLPGTLVLEANPGGTNKYYHLYNGAVPLSAIIESTVKKNLK